MTNIYNVVVRNDLHELSTDELKEITMHAEEASKGLGKALKTVGQLIFHSLHDDTYTEVDARDHLSGLSDLLMYLPLIMSGIQQNAITAQFEISRREGNE